MDGDILQMKREMDEKRNLDLNGRETNSYYSKQTADASPLALKVIPETRTAIYIFFGGTFLYFQHAKSYLTPYLPSYHPSLSPICS